MIAGVAMVKDEADIIRFTLDHMLTQVDRVFVLDNNSTDGTGAILDSFGDRIEVRYDPEVAYRQSDKLTALAHVAASQGATWIVPFDADEAWFLPPLETVVADVVVMEPYIFVPTPCDDAKELNPLKRIRWRYPTADPHVKVAYRYHPDAVLAMGNHDVVRHGARIQGGVIRHYMYRSLEQVRRKVANGTQAYDQAPDLRHHHGSHWYQIAGLTPDQQEEWWWDYVCDPTLMFDEWMPW